MSDFVTVNIGEHDPSIAVVTINNPPVNAMSIGVPGAILSALKDLEGNKAVLAILLVAGGKGVLAGADIKVQGKAWPEGEPNLLDLIAGLDACGKPVAILNRVTALGGGLEISMGCRYRIAQTGTKLGQPEVKLGIPPGAGGTQRLPRLVGAEKALDMIVSGDPISAEEGLKIGLVDHVVSTEAPVSEAVSFLAGVAGSGTVNERARDRDVVLEDSSVFDSARAMATKKFKGQQSPLVCIDCVEAATTMPFEEGYAYERKRFLECVASDEAAALRYVFFAERQAKKVPGIGKSIEARKVEQAAVLGAGTMGTGIAMCFANAGIPVTIIEREQEPLDRGMARIADTYDSQAKRGRLTAEEAARRTALVRPAVGLKAAAEADIVVEAVFEEMAIKQQVFSDLAEIAKADAILATNTSYLNVDEIAAATNGREADVLGMHFFSPANIMKLLEVVRADKTADDVLLSGLQLGARIGKVAVVAGVCHGFIGNRMFSQYNREAEFLLQEGATCAQVDGALKKFGMAMGSFAVRDLAGLDIGWAMRKSTAHLRNAGERYSTVCDRICERGWFGQKTGKGFYLYDDGKPSPNPEVQKIVDETGKEAGITPEVVTDEAVVERCIYALVNEGAKIVDEGFALRSSDIDLVFLNGYGFPRWRGGPMHWADTIGLPKVLEAIRKFDSKHDFWKPAPLLEKLVSEGKKFADYDRENAS